MGELTDEERNWFTDSVGGSKGVKAELLEVIKSHQRIDTKDHRDVVR